MSKSIRPYLILDQGPATWTSGHSISTLIGEAYFRRFKTRLYSRLSPFASGPTLLDHAEKILNNRPTHIVFAGYQAQAPQLIRALEIVSRVTQEPLPKLIVHLYGDFTMLLNEWASAEKALNGKRVHFLCGSARQKNLVAEYLRSGDAITSTCHFPVDTNTFKQSLKSRDFLRKRWKLSRREKVFLFAGRISQQKNVALLAEQLGRHFGHASYRLLIAGSFDELGSPHFGKKPLPGSLFNDWNRRVFSNRSLAARTSLLGNVTKKELHELYCLSNLYVSLSVHHDEDFGLSAAEALCSGTPAILSSWGGHGTFAHPSHCHLLPIEIGRNDLRLDLNDLGKSAQVLLDENSEYLRKKRAALYGSAFSPSALEQKLDDILKQDIKPFSGFSDAMREQLARMEKSQSFGVFRRPSKADPLYHRIYRHYVNETQGERAV